MTLFKTIFLFLFGLSAMAQGVVELNNAEKKNIRLLARSMVERNLRDLLNTIAFDDASPAALREVMLNSYLPNNNQVFYNDGAIIEDDITPENTDLAKGSDLNVERYLSNLNLFYKKTDRETIFFSEVLVSPEVQISTYPFVKVYFKSWFKGEHKSKKPYKAVLRVAELRAEKDINNNWKVFITHIGFYRQAQNEGPVSVEQRRQQARRDSTAAAELKQTYQKKMEELLAQGQIVINTTNDKNSAANVFTLACYYRDNYRLNSPKFEELYKEYMNKGDVVFDAEIFDNAQKWYELAQAIKDSPEIREKIKACRR